MRKALSVLLLIPALCIALTVVNADDAKEEAKVKCAVAGKEVPMSKAVKVDYKGAHVYVCCNGCKAKMAKTPEKFAAKANHQLVSTGQAKQVKCPIAGRACNASKKLVVAGVETQFCCGGCLGKASKAQGDARIELVFNDKAFEKGFEIIKEEE